MSADRVAIEVEDHVADVRLVRADKHNALDGEMFLAKDVLELARTGQKGFRLVGFEPFPDE